MFITFVEILFVLHKITVSFNVCAWCDFSSKHTVFDSVRSMVELVKKKAMQTSSNDVWWQIQMCAEKKWCRNSAKLVSGPNISTNWEKRENNMDEDSSSDESLITHRSNCDKDENSKSPGAGAQMDIDPLKNDSNQSEGRDESATLEHVRIDEHTDGQSKSSVDVKPFSLKCVPIERLTGKREEPIAISSSSNSDDPVLVKLASPKRRHTKTRPTRRRQGASYAEMNSASSDDSVERPKRKSRSQVNHDVYAVRVNLKPLPSDMAPIMRRFNLSEIRDAHQNVIATREKTQHNEVLKPYCIWIFQLFLLFPHQRPNASCNRSKAPHMYLKIIDFHFLLVEKIEKTVFKWWK